MGGKGGGRPDFAQGAVPDRSKIAEAFKKAESLVGIK
jgi:alanyl-tRNA synthetase